MSRRVCPTASGHAVPRMAAPRPRPSSSVLAMPAAKNRASGTFGLAAYQLRMHAFHAELFGARTPCGAQDPRPWTPADTLAASVDAATPVSGPARGALARLATRRPRLAGVLARRKPRTALRSSRLFLLRLAERRFLGLLFQPPPRTTRRAHRLVACPTKGYTTQHRLA
jgi:hypothetical protein